MTKRSKPVIESLSKIIQILTENPFGGQIVIKIKEGEPIQIKHEAAKLDIPSKK